MRPLRFQTIAILGAGTMGAQIAAHFANAGCAVDLLDLSSDDARRGLDRAVQLKPDPFFTPQTRERVNLGGFDRDLERIASADWIVEAIVERVDVKRALLARVDACRRAGSVVSTNTSGLSIAALAEGCSIDFRRHFLGAHFFNPPRHLQLIEIIPTAETDPAVMAAVAEAAERLLGKDTVTAKDTPGFIANRIGLFGLARVLEALDSGEYSIEEIDAITGPAIGRPKSATFRTIDIAGLDVLAAVAADLQERLPSDRARAFGLPHYVAEMLRRGWIGEKAGRGFYERRRASSDDAEIWALDHRRLEYRPRARLSLPSLDETRDLPLEERVRRLYTGSDRVGAFLRSTLEPLFDYAARISSDIAHADADIDRAMRWGYGWSLGPFELATAVGYRAKPAHVVPDRSSSHLAARVVPAAPPPLATAAGCSLVDLGENVLGAILHSKMNALGADELAMLARAVEEADAHFAALVITAEGAHFSVGANLVALLAAARNGEWSRLSDLIQSFQRLVRAIRYSAVPVVAAPFGLTLGGGCEIALHCGAMQAAAETYIGLVETRVGLIPAGGGTKEMLVRAGPKRAFEIIGLSQTSTSAPDAMRLGYLRATDGWTMHRGRVLSEARQRALECARRYMPPARTTAIAVGGDSLRASLDLMTHLARRAGRISDHDALIAHKVSRVLSGGLPHAGHVSEDRLLELEREAFLSLCGEPKTLARIEYTLHTGKVLRN